MGRGKVTGTHQKPELPQYLPQKIAKTSTFSLSPMSPQLSEQFGNTIALRESYAPLSLQYSTTSTSQSRFDNTIPLGITRCKINLITTTLQTKTKKVNRKNIKSKCKKLTTPNIPLTPTK